MNKIYKVVWSKVKNCYVVVSEIAKNVITGSVKSAKIGKAPLANGLALGALMAFVITGSAFAQSIDVNSVHTLLNPQSVEDRVLTAGGDISSLNGAKSPTWIRPAHMGDLTVSGYDSVVYEGSNFVPDSGYFESVFYTNGTGASLTVSEIGIIKSEIDDGENNKVLFFNAQGGEMNVNATTINVENVNTAVRAEVSGAKEGANIGINATDIKLFGGRGIDVFDKAFNDDGNVNQSSGTANIDINATNRLEIIGTDVGINAVNDSEHEINVDGNEVFIKGETKAVYVYDGAKINIGKESVKVDIEGSVHAYASDGFESKIDIDLGTKGSLTGDVIAYSGGNIGLNLGNGSIWNVTGSSWLTTLEGTDGVVSVDMDSVENIVIYENNSDSTTFKARSVDLSGGAKEALTGIGEQLENKVYVYGNGVTFASATTGSALYGDVELKDGKVTTTMDTDDLVVAGKVSAGKLVATNGMSIATENGKGKFTVGAITDESGSDNTMMYVYDGEQNKLLYGVNAATGDIMTAGGIDVGGAVVIKGGLKVADGKFEVDEATGNTKVGGALSVAGGRFDVNAEGNVTGGTYNGVDIEATASQVATNKTAIEANTADIATNAANIAQNTTNIANNAAGIAQNTADIATNAANIAQNTADIATNAANIAQNTADIAINKVDIAANKTLIEANKVAIETVQSNVNDALEGKADVADVEEAVKDVTSAYQAADAGLKDYVDGNFVKIGENVDGTTTTEVSENFIVDCEGSEGATITINGDKEGQVTIDKNGQMVFGTNSTAIDEHGVYAGRIDTTGVHDFANAKAGITEDGEIKGASGKFTVDKDGNVQAETYNGVEISKDAATGEAVIDGVNIKQAADSVNDNAQAISGLNQRLGKMNGKINKVGAGAAALAALHPLEYDPDDKLTFSAGVGNYNGENAAALGAFYRPDEKLMFSLGGTMGNGENMVNLGVSIGLDGAKGAPKLSRKELAQKVSTMEAENKAIKAENEALEERVAKLEALVAKLANK